MKSVLAVSVSLCICFSPSVASAAISDTWNIREDLSQTSNPNGAWSFGRKWNLGSDDMDLFTSRWYNSSAGGTGWYLGGTQWYPSMMDGSSPGSPVYGPSLWGMYAPANGYPTVRWTCPETGIYDLEAMFWDHNTSAGINNVYVVIDGSVEFNGQVSSDMVISEYSVDGLSLVQGEHVDFLTAYVSGGSGGGGWVQVGAELTQVPEPATLLLLGLGGLLIRRRSVL